MIRISSGVLMRADSAGDVSSLSAIGAGGGAGAAAFRSVMAPASP
ncbi:MAG: hypothetical protein R3B51_04675 [Thermodesulfobacteriota bacterium]